MGYAAVTERAHGNYSACLPDVPGGVATSETAEETRRNIRETLRLHLEGLRQHGLAPPPPAATA